MAASLARRTFLPGEDGRWVVERRAELRDNLVARSSVWQTPGVGRAMRPHPFGRRTSSSPSSLFRESGYRQLMLAQSAAGNDAEALRYERCRSSLAEVLGAYPSPETETISHLDILRSEPKGAAIEVEATNGDPVA